MSIVPPSPPCASTRTSSFRLARNAAATPLATDAAFAKSEWNHATCHADSGYGVENTSRHPVAFTTISWRFVARIAASSTNRAPSASPHPWQARCPLVSVLLRSIDACTVRPDGSTRRLPTVNVPS